jgi:spore maturation protein CgeB
MSHSLHFSPAPPTIHYLCFFYRQITLDVLPVLFFAFQPIIYFNNQNFEVNNSDIDINNNPARLPV